MYRDKFVLSIIHEGHPVREAGYRGSKDIYKGRTVVALPFDSEYKIRLKNKNNRGCTARIFIDDKQVSKLGDLIINANGTIDLERFIDSSLDSGNKFKFVPLDHPDVDDPTSSENGIIKVEFRLAKKENGIKINIEPPTYKPWNWDDWRYTKPLNPWDGGTGDFTVYNSSLRSDGSYDGSVQMSFCSDNLVSDNVSSLEDGATIEGGRSNQSFVYSNLDVEDVPTTLYLKIVGIKDSKQVDKLIYRYCSKCGFKVKKTDNFCYRCGKKL